MEDVLKELAVLLVISEIGAYFGRKGLLTEACTAQLNQIVVRIAFPALILASMDQAFTPELLRNSLGLAVISWFCFGAAIRTMPVWVWVLLRFQVR